MGPAGENELRLHPALPGAGRKDLKIEKKTAKKLRAGRSSLFEGSFFPLVGQLLNSTTKTARDKENPNQFLIQIS